MKVALYARVSTDDKDQDPETQLLKLRMFCEARGFEVSRTYREIASAANPDRPRLKELMEDARRREFDAVVIVRLDRIMRSTKNLLNMLAEWEQWGVQLICVDQPIETGSAMGRLITTLLGAIAEFERELIRERVKDGMARAKAEGKHVGRSSGSKDKKPRKVRSDKGGRRKGTPLLPNPTENPPAQEYLGNKELLLSNDLKGEPQ
jgi:DNA invertase Pin-like site-specific DNA recombinase